MAAEDETTVEADEARDQAEPAAAARELATDEDDDVEAHVWRAQS